MQTRRPVALSFTAQSFEDHHRDNMQARPVTVSFFPTSTQLTKPDRSGHGEVFDGILDSDELSAPSTYIFCKTDEC